MCRVGRDGAAPRVRGDVFPVSARGGLGPWGVPQTSHEGAAECSEDLVQKGCVRRLGFLLSADGGQRPDLVNRENRAQVSRSGGLSCSLVLGDGLFSLGRPGGTSKSPSSLWCAASVTEPSARGSRGHAPVASCRLHPTRRSSGRLVVGQGGAAVRQACARGEHGVHGLQVPVALLRVWGDRHLVVVAPFQHHHGDGAGVIFASWGCCVCPLCPLWVSLHHIPVGCAPCQGLSCFLSHPGHCTVGC